MTDNSSVVDNPQIKPAQDIQSSTVSSNTRNRKKSSAKKASKPVTVTVTFDQLDARHLPVTLSGRKMTEFIVTIMKTIPLELYMQTVANMVVEDELIQEEYEAYLARNQQIDYKQIVRDPT